MGSGYGTRYVTSLPRRPRNAAEVLADPFPKFMNPPFMQQIGYGNARQRAPAAKKNTRSPGVFQARDGQSLDARTIADLTMTLSSGTANCEAILF